MDARTGFTLHDARRARNVPMARKEAVSERLEFILSTIAIAALSVIYIYGTFAALIFILAAVGLMAIRPLDNAKFLVNYLPLLLIPIFACISATWSDAPSRTLRAGLQLTLTFMAGMIAARRCKPETLVGVLLISAAVVAISTIPQIPGSIRFNQPLRGPFPSKNAMGFLGQLGMLLAFTTMLNREIAGYWRFMSLLLAPLFIVLIYAAQSAGAETTTGIFMFVFVSSLLLGRLDTTVRWVATAGMLIILALLMLFMNDISDALTNARSTVLNKDATLTGRTYLWDTAKQLSAQRPWLGYGYNAFWRQGYVEAEALWRWGGVRARSGFNFHNEFIEMKVGMGLVGFSILVASFVIFFIAGIIRHLRQPSTTTAFFLALQAAFYAKAFAEFSLIAPFSQNGALWIAGAVYTFMPSASQSNSAKNALTVWKPRMRERLVRQKRVLRRV